MACVTVLKKSWDWCQAEADEARFGSGACDDNCSNSAGHSIICGLNALLLWFGKGRDRGA